MKRLWFSLLLSSSFLLAQNSNPSDTSHQNTKIPKDRQPYKAVSAEPAAITY